MLIQPAGEQRLNIIRLLAAAFSRSLISKMTAVSLVAPGLAFHHFLCNFSHVTVGSRIALFCIMSWDIAA